MCDGRRKNVQRLPTVFILVGLVLAFLVCGCVSARYALAEDASGGGSFDYAVVYGPNSAAGLSDSDDPRYLVQVYESNNFDAALLALGYNPTSSSFTDDARAYLSNQSTGGAFYDFAQLFSNNNTDWGEEITTNPSLTPGINFDVTNMETALRLNNSIYGADNVWSAEYTTSQRIAAVSAVGLVLSGSVSGGGGAGSGTDVTTDTVEFTLKPYLLKNTNVGFSSSFFSSTHFLINGSYKSYAADTCYTQSYAPSSYDVTSLGDVIINVTLNLSKIGFDYTDYDFYLFGYPRQNTWHFEIYAFQKGHYDISYNKTNRTFTGYSPNLEAEYTTISINTDVNYYDYSNNNLNPNLNADYVGTISYSGSFSRRSAGLVTLAPYTTAGFTQGFGFSGGETNTVPPTNWPDPPENPTVDPPSVPEPPSGDPIEQPTDTPIQPPNVWMPIAGTTDPTFTVDLQGILDAMSAHCQHIRDNLDGNFAQLYNNMTDYWSRKYTNFKQFLDGQFGYVGDTIVDETKELMEYLEDLFEWLAEQFDFSVSGTGYNDNTVVSWLRKIYARLGGGTTIKPPDPVVDPKGTGDWLSQLLENLVNELLGLGQDVLADLVESFRELITKFPFSIPWDIAAILALLVAEPQAPVLEIPQYTYTGVTIQQVGAYRLDLSEWNSVMEVVRPMETILFAGWLAFKTDFFKGLLELTKG